MTSSALAAEGLGGGLGDPVAQFLHGFHQPAPDHGGDLASAGLGVGVEGIGVAAGHLDLFGGQGQQLRRDLPQERVGAGADVGNRGQHRDFAAGVARDFQVDGAAAAGVPKAQSHAPAGVLARLVFVPAGGRQSGFDGLAAADLFHPPLVGQHVAVLHQVPEPYRHRIQVQLPGQHVQQRLDGEDRLRLSRRLHVAARHPVGVDVVGADGVVGDAVGVDDVRAVDFRRLEARVGAAVEVYVAVQRHQGPVAFRPELDAHDRGVARIAGHQLLGVVHHHPDRAPGGPGEVVADRHVHL